MEKVDIVEYQNLSEPVRVTVVTGLLNIPDTGVPKGGKKGQNLTKKSDSNYDIYWADPDDINSIEHITLNGEDVPVEDKTANIKVDAKTIGFESTNVAYTDKENTFTEPQTFNYVHSDDPNWSEYGELGGSGANYSYLEYTDDTHKYSTSGEAYISSYVGRVMVGKSTFDEKGTSKNSLVLDVRKNWIARTEINAERVDGKLGPAVQTYYAYKFPKTYPNKEVTLATIEDLTAQLDTKLDKAGGTISGSLIIAENLTVQGKTTSVDTQNLKVADKLIYVAKDNTIALTSPAGLITPKYDGTNNGGIVYDNTGTAYVGDIVLDENGNVDVAKSNLQPISTRENAVDWEDKHVAVWDKENQRLADGDAALSPNALGHTVAVRKTDGRLAFQDGKDDGDGATISQLKGYVPIDGVYEDEQGTENSYIRNNGDSIVLEVSGNSIKLGKDYLVYNGIDITPGDYVKKLATSLINQAYVRNSNGEDSGLAYTYTDEGNTLALRNASGQLQVSDPSQDNDAANKKFVEDNLNSILYHVQRDTQYSTTLLTAKNIGKYYTFTTSVLTTSDYWIDPDNITVNAGTVVKILPIEDSHGAGIKPFFKIVGIDNRELYLTNGQGKCSIVKRAYGSDTTPKAIGYYSNVFSVDTDSQFGGQATSKYSTLFGVNVRADSNAEGSIVGGRYCIIDSPYTFAYGRSITTQATQETITKIVLGYNNKFNTKAILEIGNGTDSIKSNAFEVLEDGRAKVQTAPVDTDDVVRKLELDNVNARYVSTSILGG